jgi:hypothetical protein
MPRGLEFAAKAYSEDNISYSDAMNGPDSLGLKQACGKEVYTLAEKMHAWDVVDRELGCESSPAHSGWFCSQVEGKVLCSRRQAT